MQKEKKRKYFIGMIHTNGEGGDTKSIGVKSMGKTYKAPAAEGYYYKCLEILYYVYIYIFPRLTEKKEKKVLFLKPIQNQNYES